jgi:hypothetical protein
MSGSTCINTMTDIPENALRARQSYIEGMPTREIMAQTELSLWALYYWLAGGPKKNGVRVLEPISKRRLVTRRRILKEERVHMVERMMRAAERQIREIEERLAGTQQEPGATERDARTLAVLARTMQSLTALDALHEKGPPKPKAPKNESVPRSIDELRRSLARKLEAIIAERDAAPARKGK